MLWDPRQQKNGFLVMETYRFQTAGWKKNFTETELGGLCESRKQFPGFKEHSEEAWQLEPVGQGT